MKINEVMTKYIFGLNHLKQTPMRKNIIYPRKRPSGTRQAMILFQYIKGINLKSATDYNKQSNECDN